MKKGVNMNISVNHVADNSVDIRSDEISFSVMFSNDLEKCHKGLQLNEPFHSDPILNKEIENRLIKISREVIKLNMLMTLK